MQDQNKCCMQRRQFLVLGSSLFLGSQLLFPLAATGRKQQKKGLLPDKISAKDKELIGDSALAQDMANFFGQGYSCAESILMVGLRHLKMPETMMWAAGGFGGGMGQRDLCGFLTGGAMAIGFACGQLKLERKAAKKICSRTTKTFWQWWQTEAPLHCSEIRPKKSPKGICSRLGQLSAAKLEELLKEIKG